MEFIDLKKQQARIRPSIDARIQRVLDHGRYIMGPEVDELEAQLASYIGGGEAITVASGTDALLVALMALGVGRGDEVITTAFTFVATVETIALLGARPVFVDIEADTLNLNAALVEAAITRRTRAILAVDLFGQCADYPALEEIAQRHGVALIEDAAQSFGARLGGRRAGSFGTIACTSFFPAKPLGGYGDGGACFTQDKKLAQAMREIRLHGQASTYQYSRVGINGRLDTLQAAILLAKLEIFDDEVARREVVAKRYNQLLPSEMQKPVVRPGRTSVWAHYTVQVDDPNAVRASLSLAGIPSNIYYPKPLHHHRPYRQYLSLPVTEAASARVLSLPMHPYLEAAEQGRVAEACRSELRPVANFVRSSAG